MPLPHSNLLTRLSIAKGRTQGALTAIAKTLSSGFAIAAANF